LITRRVSGVQICDSSLKTRLLNRKIDDASLLINGIIRDWSSHTLLRYLVDDPYERTACALLPSASYSSIRRLAFLPAYSYRGRVEGMRYQDIITIEAGKRGGKPCIRGMRITVYDVFSYLASGMTVQQILDDFPFLTAEDIQACYAFAADRERLSTLAHSETSV